MALQWDPPSQSVSNSIESIQHFTLKLTSKSWSSSHPALLSSPNIPTLQHRRKKAKIILAHKQIKNSISLTHNKFSSKPLNTPIRLTRQYSCHNFQLIPCRTSSFSNSFFPSSIKLWNALPYSTKSSTSLSLLKCKLNTTEF